MAFEQFKTQVLLLHSEQSTLDSLSTGFTDKYAVHCATSGIEALNTLGATPIDVIVSAQELAGMSGLDALREAKKRSPETIAILMAGTDTSDGLEALVSDKEVFQVIRGEVAPDTLRELVDNATKTARLMALAESANDTSADVDEPGEHIVMETAENGSAIVSDGTGQVPVLKPEKLSSQPTSAGQGVDVLVLTQDDEFLATIKESSLGTHHVHHAVKPGQAEDLMRKNPVGVLVTDAAMAGANVEALTQRMRTHRARLVAIVAGRRDDGEMLMDLINRGQVYRFLLKPVSPGRARLAIEASVKHHLEAPDQAFKPRTGTPPPPPKARPKPAAAKPPVPPAEKPKPEAAAKPKAKPKPVKAPPAPDGLDDAFDEASSFTETMTGIASSVGKSISSAAGSIKPSKKNDEPQKPAPTPTPAPAAAPAVDEAGVGGGSALNPRIIGIAAAVVVAAIAGFFALSGGDDAAPQATTVEQATPAVAEPEPLSAPAPETSQVAAPEPALPAPAQAESAPVATQAESTSALTEAAPVVAVPVDNSPVEEPAQPDPVVASNPAPESQQPAVDVAAPGAASEAEVAPAAETASPSPEVLALLERARDARAAGDVYAPAGNNAVEFYLEARGAAPGNETIATEFNEIVSEVYGLAEAALLDSRTTDASRALRVLGLADPGNPRITFLTTQLTQQEVRGALDNARTAIRESRFEDAGRELARAESVVGGSSAEIDALSAELAAARNARQLDDVLGLAGERFAADQLLAPENDNARYYYDLALSIDGNSTPAQQGLLAIASKLVLRARTAIDAGELDQAASILDDARELDPNSAEVAAAEEALQAAAAPPPAPVPEQPTDSTPAASTEPEATPPPTAAATLDDAAATDSVAEPAQPETVSITALRRTNYVPPRYPRGAQRRNQTGYVDVIFAVEPDGSVGEVEVYGAEPEGVFDEAAVEAVRQWEFEPVVENGTAVSKRVAVRMSFNLQ